MLAAFFLPDARAAGGLSMAVQPAQAAEPRRAISSRRRILDSLSEAIVVVDARGLIHYANLSAEQFFGVGRARLVGHPLDEFVPEDTPLFSLLEQVLTTGGAVAENGVTLSLAAHRQPLLRAAPLADRRQRRPGRGVAGRADRSPATSTARCRIAAPPAR